MIPQTKTAQAYALAEWLHGDQFRKNTDEEAVKIPYLTHLIDVMSLLIQVGANDDQLIAGLLHDALEDQSVTPDGEVTSEVIERMFGLRVLELVEAATDGSSGVPRDETTWRSRKQAHLDEMAEHMKTDAEALLVPLADKLANGQAIVNDLHHVGSVVWDRFNAKREDVIWYYTSALAVFESAFGSDHVLVGRLRRVVWEMSDENVGKYMWRMTVEVLEELGETGIFISGENLTYLQIYGPGGKMGHFSGTWPTAEAMRSALSQNHGGGVPMAVIEKLVLASEVTD